MKSVHYKITVARAPIRTAVLLLSMTVLVIPGLQTLALATETVEVRGLPFPRRVEISGAPVEFRGGAVCRYLGFKVYTAVFYAAPEAKRTDEILGASPKRLVLHYERDIRREDIVTASEQTLRENPDVDLEALRERLDRLYAWYEDVEAGDRFWLDYTPESGSALYFNGKLKGVIPGEDFAEAFYGIWLSDYPISRKYRNRLLGQ